MNEHSTKLCAALDTLLVAIAKHDKAEAARRRKEDDGIRVYRYVLLRDIEFKPDHGEELMRDPVGISLRRGVQYVGKMLARTEGMSAMHEAADRVLAKRGTVAVDVVDKWWDGIVDRDGKPWGC